MRILPFKAKAKDSFDDSPRDWDTQEIADFYRAYRLLSQNGTNIGMDRGLSDIGEPWMVFFDNASNDVFLHIARISGQCILVCDTLNLKLSTADITSLIAEFEHSVRRHFEVATQRSQNVFVHPAARIIMSISAIFLLFKLESGEAHAKVLAEHGGPSNQKSGSSTNEKTSAATNVSGPAQIENRDSNAFSRAQAAFSRVFDSVSTPNSAALLAGIILTSEFALPQNTVSANAATADRLPTLTQQDVPEVQADRHVIDNQFSFDRFKKLAFHEEVRSEAHQQNTVVSHIDLHKALPEEVTAQAFEHRVITDILPVTTHPLIDQGTVVLPAAQPKAVTDQGVAKPEAQDKDTQASKVLEFVLDDHVVTKEKAAPTSTHITAENLQDVDDHVGFFMETHYSAEKLYAMMEYFTHAMGEIDFDYSNGKVLIEDKDLSSMSDQNIGIWTNVLSDGSSVSVAGHIDLIDDIATFFT